MAHRPVILGGAGATFSLDELLKVVHGNEVALDHAAAERVKKESPPPKAFQAEQAPAAAPAADGSGPWLDGPQARAALLYKLLSLINGRSKVRLAVVEALAALLNSHVTPALPASDADCAALAALAAALQGVGSTLGSGGRAAGGLADALAAAGLAAPGLSTAERAVVEDGLSASGGSGAICVQAGKLLLAVANSVAALGAEALQAEVGGRWWGLGAVGWWGLGAVGWWGGDCKAAPSLPRV